MTTANKWNRMREEHELAYFRADVCLGSPQSYSLEEKRRICVDMDASTAEIDAQARRLLVNASRNEKPHARFARRLRLRDAQVVGRIVRRPIL